MSLPTDTLADLHGRQEGLTEDAIALMKALYLAIGPIAACARANNWSPTQTINAAEMLRRRGLLKLFYDKERGTFTYQAGAAA